jgi:hypothetical protein
MVKCHTRIRRRRNRGLLSGPVSADQPPVRCATELRYSPIGVIVPARFLTSALGMSAELPAAAVGDQAPVSRAEAGLPEQRIER